MSDRWSFTGRYRRLEPVGVSPTGAIYRALDSELDRMVLLKLGSGSDSEPLQREVQLLGQLQHPHIAGVFDVGRTDDGCPYYTMPLPPARTLQDVFAGEQADDSLVELVRAVQRVAQALAYAHRKGVAHGNLRPAAIGLGDHGEVYVSGWTDAPLLRTRTLASARQRGDDVRALGHLLSEIVALDRHRQGDAPGAQARDNVSGLLSICRAARAEPPARAWSEAREPVQELQEELQTWLDAQSESKLRRDTAARQLVEGEAALASWRLLKEERRKRQDELVALRQRIESWQPLAEKAELLAAEDRITAVSEALIAAAAEVVTTLGATLEHQGDNARARALLADYYHERLDAAEAAGDREESRLSEERLREHDDGRYQSVLAGTGALSLSTIPAGASVSIAPCVERGLCRVTAASTFVGSTPVESLPLAMGSYLAVIEKPGFRPVRYPLSITRNRHWRGRVRLHTEEQIGRGFVYVPGGPFVRGSRGATGEQGLELGETELGDYSIAVHPVTIAEYLEFLNALGSRAPELADERLQRRTYEPADIVKSGRAFTVAERDPAAQRELLRHPVTAISWQDACAYCAWRSRRDGRRYRLPSELEWEKAARGVDGRAFPWGDRFDPSLCNMVDSLAEPRLLPIDAIPADVSVYGVRGMAGNSRDMTSTPTLAIEHRAGTRTHIGRGGHCKSSLERVRCAARVWLGEYGGSPYRGFRLAAAAGDATHPRDPTV